MKPSKLLYKEILHLFVDLARSIFGGSMLNDVSERASRDILEGILTEGISSNLTVLETDSSEMPTLSKLLSLNTGMYYLPLF